MLGKERRHAAGLRLEKGLVGAVLLLAESGVALGQLVEPEKADVIDKAFADKVLDGQFGQGRRHLAGHAGATRRQRAEKDEEKRQEKFRHSCSEVSDTGTG